MMSYGSDPSLPPAYAQPAQKGWLGRNWLWFVPVVVLLPICACGGICGGSMLYMMQWMKSSGAYKLALETTQENPEVKAALGEPIEETWIAFGAVSTDTARGGQANLGFRVQGPNGAAMVECVARQPAGSDDWELTKLVVRPDDGGAIVIVGEETVDWQYDDEAPAAEMDEPEMDEPEMPADEPPADDLATEESETESPGPAAAEEADRLREDQPEN